MVKMKKKIVMGAGILALASLTLAACGGKEKEAKKASDFSIEGRYEVDATKPAWQLDTKKDNKLTWYINADWLKLDWGQDMVTAKIKEDLNLDVEIITGDDTKLNTMFSGGELPDIVTLTDFNSAAAKKANTWALPLDELAKNFDPYFNEVAAQETLNWFTMDDGKTYGYPNFSNTTQDYKDNIMPVNTNFIIRKDVYDAIGQPKLDTPENFRQAMKDISAKFPDLVPFGFNPVVDNTGALEKPLQDWIGVPLETEDGEFYDRNLDEDYLTWLKTINEVYQDGNVVDDSFADDGPTFDEKVKSGKYATMLLDGISGQGGRLQEFNNANPGNEYLPIDGPQSTKGNEPTLNATGLSGWMINYVSKDAKDPAKAIQLFTYLISEQGQILTKFGIEGETFQYTADNKIEILPEIQQLQLEKPEEASKKYRLTEFLLFSHDRTNLLAAPKKDFSLKKMQEWGVGKLKPHFIIENIKPEAGTAEARSFEQIEKNWHTSLISMLRSKDSKEFDKKLDAYKKFREDNSWDDILKIQNENMAKNREKLDLDK
ncbi:sugar ABC transporter substrate-binding protein [Vagococcus allomyrinae]